MRSKFEAGNAEPEEASIFKGETLKAKESGPEGRRRGSRSSQHLRAF